MWGFYKRSAEALDRIFRTFGLRVRRFFGISEVLGFSKFRGAEVSGLRDVGLWLIHKIVCKESLKPVSCLCLEEFNSKY